MENFRIIQCIKHPEKFNRVLSDRLSVGIEIQDFFFTTLYDEGWENRVEEYREKLKDYKGIISMHGPAFDLNPASPDNKILEVTKERYYQAIKIANMLNAKYIVFHTQTNPILKDPDVKKLILNKQLDFWGELLNQFKDTDLTILLENFYDDDYKDLLLLIEKINSPKVKICLDLGHVLCNSSKSIEHWITGLKDNIKYIHFHYNEGDYDAHLPPIEVFIKEVSKILNENNIYPVIALEYEIGDLQGELKKIRGC